MNKKYRLKKKCEIDAVFNLKIKMANSYFTVYKKENVNDTNFRFAISIGKKYGNAVSRVKIKRQIRAIIQNEHHLFNICWFVIVVKPKASILKYKKIKDEILYILKKMKIKGDIRK